MTKRFNFNVVCTAMLGELGAVDTGDWYAMQQEAVARHFEAALDGPVPPSPKGAE